MSTLQARSGIRRRNTHAGQCTGEEGGGGGEREREREERREKREREKRERKRYNEREREKASLRHCTQEENNSRNSRERRERRESHASNARGKQYKLNDRHVFVYSHMLNETIGHVQSGVPEMGSFANVESNAWSWDVGRIEENARSILERLAQQVRLLDVIADEDGHTTELCVPQSLMAARLREATSSRETAFVVGAHNLAWSMHATRSDEYSKYTT
jgi:hypothetical protein